MFSGFKNSRLGKYYSAVLAKYGALAPIFAALAAFVAVMTVEEYNLFELLKANSSIGYAVTLALLIVGAVLTLYYVCSKLTCKKATPADLIIFIADVAAVIEFLRLFLIEDASSHILYYVIAVVLLAAATIVRMAMLKVEEAKKKNRSEITLKNIYEEDQKQKVNFGEAFKAYIGALAQKTNLVAVILSGLAIFAGLFLLAGSGFRSEKALGAYNIFVVISAAIALIAIISTFNNRIKFKKVNYFDGTLIALIIAAVLYIVPLVLYFSVGKVIILALVLALLVTLLIKTILSTTVEDGQDEAKRGANEFVKEINPVFAALVVVLLASVAVGAFAAGILDMMRVVLFVAAALLGGVAILVRSIKTASESEHEIYNPVKMFSKENCVAIWVAVKKVFSPEKDAHYISSKESRRIARENMRTIKEYEARKKRKNVPEEEYVTQMKDDRNIVEFENLHTYFFSDAGVVKAVNGVTFSIPQGSTVGVIGESGCGKSVTSLSLMQLVQAPKGQVIEGSQIRFKSTAYKEDKDGKHIPIYEVELDEFGNEKLDENGNPVYKMESVTKKGKTVLQKVQKRDANGIPLFETEEKVYNVAKMPTEVMRKIRGREITMIFQEPMTSLNPIFTIGNQLDEVVLLHIPGATKESAKARTFEMLKMVGIIPENVYDRFPHELSGGMRQRVVIAMALLCQPKLIIADEPTTALDVTIQAQILDLLRDIKKKINGSIMFITHDLGVIAEMADFVVVMYAGRVIEMGTAKEIFDNPKHPYTMGLQKSKPAVNKKVDRLYSIPGNVPNPINMPNYCYFRDRCDQRCDKCDGNYPEMIQLSETHKVSCHLYQKEDVTDGNN